MNESDPIVNQKELAPIEGYSNDVHRRGIHTLNDASYAREVKIFPTFKT
jgi:hypothetical protein